MKKIKNNYTNFILTVIAIAMIGILFKGEIITEAKALGNGQVWSLVDHYCQAFGSDIRCGPEYKN